MPGRSKGGVMTGARDVARPIGRPPLCSGRVGACGSDVDPACLFYRNGASYRTATNCSARTVKSPPTRSSAIAGVVVLELTPGGRDRLHQPEHRRIAARDELIEDPLPARVVQLVVPHDAVDRLLRLGQHLAGGAAELARPSAGTTRGR